jgi:hypothetical protein
MRRALPVVVAALAVTPVALASADVTALCAGCRDPLPTGPVIEPSRLLVPAGGVYAPPNGSSGGVANVWLRHPVRAAVRPAVLAFWTSDDTRITIRGIRWSSWTRTRARGAGLLRGCDQTGCGPALRATIALGAPRMHACRVPSGRRVRALSTVVVRVPALREPPYRVRIIDPEQMPVANCRTR